MILGATEVIHTDVGVQVSPGGTANVKGSWVSIGTPTMDWYGFDISFFPNSGGVRYLLDIGEGTNNLFRVKDMFIKPNLGTNIDRVYFPIKWKAGNTLKMRVQGSSANQSVTFYVRGYVKCPGSPASYSYVENLNVDTTNTKPGFGTDGTGIPTTNTWEEIIASTTKDYSGLYANIFDDSISASNRFVLHYGIGSSGNEISISKCFLKSTSVDIRLFPRFDPIFIPAGSRLSAKISDPQTSNSDTFRTSIIGVY